jgi:RNA polymerase sigma-70 factor (ECF subfamily)
MPETMLGNVRGSATLANNYANNAFKNELKPEAMLIARCKSGEAAAWDALIKQYEKPINRFAYRLCRNHDDAADITGQVFVRLYQNLHTFRNEASFAAWLFRIVRNCYQDMCVRPLSRRNVSLESDCMGDGSESGVYAIADPNPTPEAVCVENQTTRILSHAVNYLPAYQREVVRMFHVEGKSYEQIAEATGHSIGTIKSRMNRARGMLRERLMPLREVFTTS